MLPRFNEANRAAAINTNIFLNSLVLNNYLILLCDVLKWQFLSLEVPGTSLQRGQLGKSLYVFALRVYVHAIHRWRFFKMRFVNISVNLHCILGRRYTQFN